MSQAEVADRYARALLELGAETGQLDALTKQLVSVAEAYEASVDLQGVLDNPLVPEVQRKAVLDAVAQRLGLGPIAHNTLKLLAQRRRLRALPDVARRLTRLADEKSGVVRATVTAAKALDPAFVRKLEAALAGQTGRRVIIEERHDPSLIAGVVTRVGDHTVDGSLKGRLQELERQLLGA